MRILLLIIFSSFLISCANFNDAMTPSLTVKKDNFDGAITIKQPPVSSSSSMSEDWHTLGFSWTQNNPTVVYITVGVNGINNIEGVAFNIDGVFLNNIKLASSVTDYGDWSTRRFSMEAMDFEKLSKGNDVKMKVESIDTYTVSSFGSQNSGAIVNAKFSPFIEQLIIQNVLSKP